MRTTLKRLPADDKKTFEQLWSKVQLEGENVLTRYERETLRGLMLRIEQVVQQPLSTVQKKNLRAAAREYYEKLYPGHAQLLRQGRLYPIHHRCPLQHAHLFPDENINAAENLVMVREHVHERINFLWEKFRAAKPQPAADEVRVVIRRIDEQFRPWYNQAVEPPGLSLEQAEKSVLQALRKDFPELR